MAEIINFCVLKYLRAMLVTRYYSYLYYIIASSKKDILEPKHEKVSTNICDVS